MKKAKVLLPKQGTYLLHLIRHIYSRSYGDFPKKISTLENFYYYLIMTYIHNTYKYCCFIITFVRYLSSISSRKPRRVGVQVYLGAVNKPERPTHTSLLVFMFSWLKKKTPAELLRWAWLDPDPLLSTSNRVHVLNNSLCFWVWIKDNRFTSIFKTVSWHQGTMHFH